MRAWVWVLKFVFSLLIRLYPREFRDDFEFEMVLVFDEQIAKAMENGGVNVSRVVEQATTVLAVVLVPTVLEAFRRSVQRLRIA